MTTVCIIPARGGSTRIPGKNIKDFHGQPIIAFSILKARQVGLFDRIVVSTDSDAIAAVAEVYGAEVYMRPSVLALDSVGTQAVVGECVVGLELEPFDEVCCLYATAPLMDTRDLAYGYKTFMEDRSASFVMSVGYPDLCDAAQFYWGSANDFERSAPLISTHTRLIHISPSRVCDINTPDDWDRALKMYEALS